MLWTDRQPRDSKKKVPTNTNPHTFHFPDGECHRKNQKGNQRSEDALHMGDISKDFEPEGERIDSSSPRTTKSSSVKRLQMHTNH